MKPNLSASVIVALVVGLVHADVLAFLWGYISAYSPLLKWLLGFGLRSSSLQIAVFSIDFLTNVVLSLPIAYLLLKLRPAKLALFLTVAVVPGFVWFNVHLVGSQALAEFWASLRPAGSSNYRHCRLRLIYCASSLVEDRPTTRCTRRAKPHARERGRSAESVS